MYKFELNIYLEQTDDEKYPLFAEIGKTNYGESYTKSIKYKCEPYDLFKNKFSRLFNTLTSNNNYLLNNLQYLKLSAQTNDYLFYFDLDEYYLAENLNKFKSLKHLELEYFKFQEPKFELKLNSVKVFKASYCTGITISENVCYNLKELLVYKSDISYKNSPLKFPNLEKLQTYGYLDANNFLSGNKFIEAYNASIDFTSLNNIKILNVGADDFLKLKNNNTLESLTVSPSDIDANKEKKIIEKIISMKSLKKVTLSLKKIKNDDIYYIQGENPSVEKLEIYWMRLSTFCTYCNIINFQKKFPNAHDISLNANGMLLYNTNLIIKENKNCKINPLSIYGGKSNIELYCSSFEDLIEFNLVMYIIMDTKFREPLPFMKKDCNIIFKSMKSF